MRWILPFVFGFASVASALVTFPVQVSYPLTTTKTAIFTVGTLNADQVYGKFVINNLNCETCGGGYGIATTASWGFNTTSITGIANFASLANGQLVLSNSFPTNTKIVSHSGNTAVVSSPSFNGPLTNQQVWFRTIDPEANIQITGNTGITLVTSNMTMNKDCVAAGGLGGGYSTCTYVISIPAGQLVSAASNTLTLNFLKTDGNTSTIRILDFQFYQNSTSGSGACTAATLAESTPNTGCVAKVSANQFKYFDPTNPAFCPPFVDSTNIAAGHTAWNARDTLVQPLPGGASSAAIHAACSDCHTPDGRDLKYFNYNVESIQGRSQFHGLSVNTAKQIASYIATVSSAHPATPWSPVFQSGPGMDASSNADDLWAGGVGLGGVLSSDDKMYPYLFPTGTAKDWDASNPPNQHNIPISFQLMSWNQWLTLIWPGDAFGITGSLNFLSGDTPYVPYQTCLANFTPNSPSNYTANASCITAMDNNQADYLSAVQTLYGSQPPNWTAQQSQNLYGLSQWLMTQNWYLNQKYGLENMPTAVGMPAATKRAWFTQKMFRSSPSINHIQPPSAGIGNGTIESFNSLSFDWYHTATIVNNGYLQVECTQPIDFGYMYGFVATMGTQRKSAWGAGNPHSSVLLYDALMHIQGAQVMNTGNHPGTPFDCNGYLYEPTSLDRYFTGLFNVTASALNTGLVSNIFNFEAQQYYQAIKTWTPAQWYTSSNNAGPPNAFGPTPSQDMASSALTWWPRLKYLGVSTDVMSNLLYYWQQIFVNNTFNWPGLQNATCSSTPSTDISCSSDQYLNNNVCSTSTSTTIAVGTQAITVGSASGGCVSSFQAGWKVVIGTGTANVEACSLNSITGTTFNVTCAKTHSGTVNVTQSVGPTSPTTYSTFSISAPPNSTNFDLLPTQTIQFSAGPAAFTGSDAWSVVAGASAGTINSTGLFTAASSVPFGTQVTVKDVRGSQTATFTFWVKGTAFSVTL